MVMIPKNDKARKIAQSIMRGKGVQLGKTPKSDNKVKVTPLPMQH